MDLPKNKEDADARREVIAELAQKMADNISGDVEADIIACAAATILNRAYLPCGLSAQITLVPIISCEFGE